MNIIIQINKEYNIEDVMKNIKEKYNVELRKMWNGLYFENELFKKEHLTDKDFKIRDCSFTKDIISQMLVISIPPILTKNNENTIAKVLIDLKNDNIIE